MPDFKWFDCPVIIPYYGGKYELSRQLVPMIPKHERYIEVFAGGLSMYFRKSVASYSVVNDFDNDIANLYLVITEDFDSFKEYCKSIPKSRHLFTNFKLKIKAKHNINFPDYKRAAQYFYIIKNAFNNNFYCPMNKKDCWDNQMIDFIHLGREKLKHAIIENFDFRELYKRYPPKPDDFWYFDPPYIVAGNRGDYYFHDFTEEDHNDLHKMILELDKAGSKFMVSYDDKPSIIELYNKFTITKIPVIYAGQVHDRKPKNEVVVTNFAPKNKQLTIL